MQKLWFFIWWGCKGCGCVHMLFSDVMLKRGVVVMEGKGCESLQFFSW